MCIWWNYSKNKYSPLVFGSQKYPIVTSCPSEFVYLKPLAPKITDLFVWNFSRSRMLSRNSFVTPMWLKWSKYPQFIFLEVEISVITIHNCSYPRTLQFWIEQEFTPSEEINGSQILISSQTVGRMNYVDPEEINYTNESDKKEEWWRNYVQIAIFNLIPHLKFDHLNHFFK